jgi:hypothetical protein
MAKTKKIPKKIREQLLGTLSNEVGNFENDPFFVKKAKEDREWLERVGLPKELTKKK